MNLFAISLRNLRVRALSTTLTTISIAVGAFLLAAMVLLIGETERKYRASTAGFEAIVGPKEGSPLDLVLNVVFNLGQSPGVVPLSTYEEIHADKLPWKNRTIPVDYAIPLAKGDNFKGFPILGTTDEIFAKFTRGSEGPLRLADGRLWQFGHAELMQFAAEFAERAKRGEGPAPHDHSQCTHEHGAGGRFRYHKSSPLHEAVVGWSVWRDLGLELGAPVAPMHGAADEATAHIHEEDICEVVGVLEPTGTPLDRSIFIPLRVFLSMSGHEVVRETVEAAAGNVQLSAIVVRPKHTTGTQWMRYTFQTRSDAQVAWSWSEVSRLLQLIGNVTDVLWVVFVLVLVVAATSILVSLYNTMNERRREIAIMRSLGAHRGQILWIILQESLVVAISGAVLGVAACHVTAFLLADLIELKSGVRVDWRVFSPLEIWLILGSGLLGAIAGLLPAIKGSMTEVATNLAPTS
jgi:putative ABC transport system permease protein